MVAQRARFPTAVAAGGSRSNRLAEPLADQFGRVPDAWRGVTDPFLRSETGVALARYVDERVRSGAAVYPAHVFRALEFAAPDGVRLVILGQDPYHGAGQAQGLAFSVPVGWPKVPGSLRNILREIESDTGAAPMCRDDLTPWGRQNVLLLNSVLTVEEGAPQSHAGRGWEALTDALLAQVARCRGSVVFMLWGASAQKKAGLIEASAGAEHLILSANHPSPLSAMRAPVPFIGCRHFSRANAFLASRHAGEPAIRW